MMFEDGIYESLLLFHIGVPGFFEEFGKSLEIIDQMIVFELYFLEEIELILRIVIEGFQNFKLGVACFL
jgi:hypothetical protein